MAKVINRTNSTIRTPSGLEIPPGEHEIPDEDLNAGDNMTCLRGDINSGRLGVEGDPSYFRSLSRSAQPVDAKDLTRFDLATMEDAGLSEVAKQLGLDLDGMGTPDDVREAIADQLDDLD